MTVAISVVLPAKNEAENVEPLVEEILKALANHATFEIIYVNDGSTDDTLSALQAMRVKAPQLSVYSHDVCVGQSRSLYDGIHQARYDLIATLDADGQNDPADIPLLLARLLEPNPNGETIHMVAGHRVHRHDPWHKRLSSKLANGIRGWLLKDDTPDTGCGIKVFRRDSFLVLPFFDHMHRFLPALFLREGFRVLHHPVHHRERLRGQSKYGFMNRFFVGITDMFGVWWLNKRFVKAHLHQEWE
jgi:dolichol-phosphate mannosyltransferase